MDLSKNGLNKFNTSASEPNTITYMLSLEDEKAMLDRMSMEELKQTIEGYQQSIATAFKDLRDRRDAIVDGYIHIKMLLLCLDYAERKLAKTGGTLPLKMKATR